MVVEFLEGTLEARIVHLLMELYPATDEDIIRELKVRPSLLDRTLRGLAIRGIVELEPLPGRTFVRLLRQDFAFVGRKETQRKRVKHRGKGPNRPKEYEGPMFG